VKESGIEADLSPHSLRHTCGNKVAKGIQKRSRQSFSGGCFRKTWKRQRCWRGSKTTRRKFMVKNGQQPKDQGQSGSAGQARWFSVWRAFTFVLPILIGWGGWLTIRSFEAEGRLSKLEGRLDMLVLLRDKVEGLRGKVEGLDEKIVRLGRIEVEAAEVNSIRVAPDLCAQGSPCEGLTRGSVLHIRLTRQGYAAAYLQDRWGNFFNQEGRLIVSNLTVGDSGLWPGTDKDAADKDYKLWVATSEEPIPISSDSTALSVLPPVENGYVWGPVYLRVAPNPKR